MNSDNVKLTLADYLRIHANLRDLSDDLITSFNGGRYYDDGDHVWLYSHINLVSPGHSAQLVDSGSMYQIVDPVDTSGFMDQYKAHSYEVYGKVIYMGDLFKISSEKYYDSVCGVKGCIYAVGFFCKHVSSWSYDESAVLTPEKALSNCSVDWNKTWQTWQIWVQAGHFMIKIC